MRRHSVIPAVHLLLEKDGKVLLLRRFQTGYEDGNYSVPAGHIEAGETATQAVIREAKEEIGIISGEDDLHCVHVMHRVNKGEWTERIDFFFQLTKWTGSVLNCEPEKCDELAWADLDHLPKNTVPYIRSALSHVNNAVFFSEFGWDL